MLICTTPHGSVGRYRHILEVLDELGMNRRNFHARALPGWTGRVNARGAGDRQAKPVPKRNHGPLAAGFEDRDRASSFCRRLR
jgi:hypothetical protein